MANKQPSHTAFIVVEKHRNSFWNKVGVAFAHKDGEGFDILITPGISVSGKLTIRTPKKEDGVAEADGDADQYSEEIIY